MTRKPKGPELGTNRRDQEDWSGRKRSQVELVVLRGSNLCPACTHPSRNQVLNDVSESDATIGRMSRSPMVGTVQARIIPPRKWVR